jgi:hypothetical protein
MADRNHLEQDEVVEDVREFVAAIESIHPAPFVRAGGRFAYYREMQALLDEVPADGWSERRLHEALGALAAEVRDAHTFLPWDTADGRLPVRLGVVDDAVRVRAVDDEGDVGLVGATLRAVDGVDFDTLRRRQGRLRGSETPHGDLLNLALSLSNWRSMAPLLDRTESPEAATFEFETPDGTVFRETLGPTATADVEWAAPSTLDRPTSGGWPTYRLLPDRDAAWLRIPSMSDHREQFEYRREDLGERDEPHAKALYRAHTGQEPPDSLDETLEGIPAALDVFRDLAAEMATAETETLLVDLRENTGGTRVLTDLLAYVLDGWDGVVTARDRPGALRYSERFVDHRGDGPFEEASEDRGWDLRPGEYAIDGGDPTVEDVRGDLVDSLPTFERLESPDWPFAAHYRPSNVVVVASARTFSAGLSLLTALVRLGATVVGTPPVQAPAYFGDLVGFDLPNSEIRAMTATSRIETLPDGPDDLLEPERRLTAEDWAADDFDRDASVRLALDEYC